MLKELKRRIYRRIFNVENRILNNNYYNDEAFERGMINAYQNVIDCIEDIEKQL